MMCKKDYDPCSTSRKTKLHTHGEPSNVQLELLYFPLHNAKPYYANGFTTNVDASLLTLPKTLT